ncbi:glycosyltransferase [Maridesulfovibrio sp.]|uniref:glycosyltransferase n=1 Tax=Maridesulfovibrio sp. TaxID=2795000 RepID=UPI0039EF93B1
MILKEEKNLLKEKLRQICWDDRYEKYINEIEFIKQTAKDLRPLKASVVVISHNIKQESIDTLEKLKSEAAPFEIIFVDNNSQTQYSKMARVLSDTYIRLQRNTGAYFARNIGSVYSNSPLLIFIDDDAIPAPNFVSAHISENSKYESILIRGACLPNTDTPLNSKAKHYILGDKVFPRFSDLEGNMSVRAEAFFKAGGWDDNIKFGHGGIELSYRLLKKFPYPQLMLYSPLPIIRHDYTSSEEALISKRHKQATSWRYLQSKHAEIGTFLPRWNNEWSKLPAVKKGQQDSLISAADFASKQGPSTLDTPEYASMLRLARRYKKSGNMEKAEQYEEKARQIAASEAPEEQQFHEGEPVPPNEEQLMAFADLLMLGEYDQVLALPHANHQPLISIQSAAAMRKGDLKLAEELINLIEDTNEKSLKLKALQLLPKLAEPLPGNPRVHLIILCYNREKELTRALTELANTNYDNYAVYIADNGSSDNTWERIQEAVKLFPEHIPIHMERLPTNIGRPAGHNWLLTKYDHSESDYIAIGDDDLVQVPENWLIDMLKTAEIFPNAVAVGGKSLDPGHPPIIHAGVRNIEKFGDYKLRMSNGRLVLDTGQFDFIDLVDHVIGCLHIYNTKALFDKVGLFDIALSPCQNVDIEHHLRSKLMGYDIVFNGFIQFQHMRAMGKSVSKDKVMSGNSFGNLIKVLAKHDKDKVAEMLLKDREKRAEWLKIHE